MRRLALLLAVGLITVACGGDEPATSPSPPPSTPGSSPTSPSPATSEPAGNLEDVRVALEEVATLDGSPLAMAVRSGDAGLYVADKLGTVMVIRGGRLDPVLDISDRVSTGSEQGLLGLAFSADGRFLYVNYTDGAGDTNVVEYTMDGARARAASARRVLKIAQPFANHNGGNLVFGPDGYLYIGMGDGGSQGDPMQNGQNRDSRLAKMLRIDPRPSGGRPYGIPPDNPFTGGGRARAEVWALGLRNPWRYSFDRATGDLWIGDVGGSNREEVDLEPAGSRGGRNYGWSLMEGTVRLSENLPPRLVAPTFEYETGSEGTCAIVGGYVYRGDAIPALRGAYLYSDYCAGVVKALRYEGGKVVQRRALGLEVNSLASFGEDQNGELYVLSLSGEVFRIVPA